ncbi:MAG: trypsin-like peptidase domain-containing protein [Armatimonadetes bacterium]|nr:trypsin-like peptidase domain-containing protein [Armatimonadota bacterium]
MALGRFGVVVMCAALAATIAVLVGRPHAAAQETTAAERGVFLLEVIGQEGSGYREFSSGTAFFTDAEGTALTTSHVVWRPHRDPARFQLLAILDGAFFSAKVVCASRLTQDPTRPAPAGVPLERDVAQIKVVLPDVPFGQWGVRAPDGQFITVARKHEGPMPSFFPLTLGADPRQGDGVRIVGFGRLPIPRRWSATGTVREVNRAPDGTPVFTVVYDRAAAPGHSGSPVLNGSGQVAGIFAGGGMSDDTWGIGISSSALRVPCR